MSLWCNHCRAEVPWDHQCPDLASEGAAPRAEGLDVERLAEVMWDTSNAGAETPWVDVPSTSVRRSDMLGWAQAIVREYARRPSDERVHTGIDFGVPEGDYTGDLGPSDERVPESVSRAGATGEGEPAP